MKILFADALDDTRLDQLRSAGHDCVVEPALDATTLPAAIGDAEVLVVRSTKVTAETIEAARNLGLIVRAGAGTDNVDRSAASRNGIYVCNVPGRNAIAVAELTMGLLLSIDRRIADNVADLRAGRWDKAQYTKADGLAGKRMAIIGLGDIGLAVAERAKAFGIVVSAVRKDDRSVEVANRIRSIGIRLVDSLDVLLSDTDIVSVHVPKSESTIGMVDATFLAKLPDGATVLNTARGDVVDEAALLSALDERGFSAGLDVYHDEPATSAGMFDSRLARHPRVVGTHHIGASTRQAQEAVADGTVEVINAYIAGHVQNCVNLARGGGGDLCVSIRHLDRVGVLAQVLSILRSAGLNVAQMSNQLFTDKGAAVATINVNGSTDAAALARLLEGINEVLAVSITQSASS